MARRGAAAACSVTATEPDRSSSPDNHSDLATAKGQSFGRHIAGRVPLSSSKRPADPRAWKKCGPAGRPRAIRPIPDRSLVGAPGSGRPGTGGIRQRNGLRTVGGPAARAFTTGGAGRRLVPPAAPPIAPCPAHASGPRRPGCGACVSARFPAAASSELLTSRNHACITGGSKATRRAAPGVPPPQRMRRETSSRPTITLHRLLRTSNPLLRNISTLGGHVRSSEFTNSRNPRALQVDRPV